ncbi:hypothetical protein H6S82_02140 [Planktothrix sp. FACHB-1355]|uniref:hypothetical protein n=1 Tax=Planktothrix sp. FACHB-1355 TaxID=2692854 RepID=UPI00168A4ACF|nr:hypothetical protein [Planktothrix sp. FACHB-1355]MBD3557664.1 hypothetical protein [Planktothrix sp. FACHB-1355]
MKKNKMFVMVILFFIFGLPAVHGQTEATKSPKSINGEIVKIDLQGSQIKINAGNRKEFVVTFTANTSFKKIPPGALNLEKAVAITPNDLDEGDKLLALGKIDEAAKTVEAIQVIIVSAKDLNEISAKSREEWLKNGIIGEIIAVDPAGKQATVKIRQKEKSETISLNFSDASQIRRFSNDSVAYRDAVQITLEKIKPNDLFRALVVDKGDGVREVREILIGSFQLYSGTVTEIDQNSQQLKIKELVSGQVMTVVLNADTYTRSLSKNFAELINQNLKNKTSELPDDISQQIKNMPPANLSGIKVGDMVLLSSLAAEKPISVKALYLLTGVEPFLEPIQKSLQSSKNQSNYKLGLPEGLNNLFLGL